MGAVSQSAMLHRIGNLLKDIGDALDRGVAMDEVEVAIVKLEPTRSDTPRREPKPI